MLVLGEEAKKGGLDKSLLERLLLKYSQLDKVDQIATCACRSTLVTNYRCHKSICRLSKELFYPTTPLKVFKDDKPHIIPLNDSQTSLHFLCCDVGDSVESSVNKTEAVAVVTVLQKIVSKWPHHGVGKIDTSRICVMSKSRSQVKYQSLGCHNDNYWCYLISILYSLTLSEVVFLTT
jgi:superfamily I DNA and/or RNA helicase